MTAPAVPPRDSGLPTSWARSAIPQSRSLHGLWLRLVLPASIGVGLLSFLRWRGWR